MKEDIILVDTHAHLDMINAGKGTAEVLERAGEQGVRAVISVGIDLESSRKAVDYSNHYPGVYAAVGIHPNDAAGFEESDLSRLKMLAGKNNVVAWGEIGLDYFRMHTPVNIQKKAFESQLEAAASLQLPVIIHDRDAHEDCISILESFLGSSSLKGVFHCFSADRNLARKVMDLGFFVSFTGVVTFPKARDLMEVVEFVPMDLMMIETDSPFLSPAPFRGKVNEPARVRIVAEKIAEIKGLPLEEVAEWTTKNAVGLFGLQLL